MAEQLTLEIEALAAIEHEQWMEWAKSIMATVHIPPERQARWTNLMVPYSELSEENKELDRKWARKALCALEQNSAAQVQDTTASQQANPESVRPESAPVDLVARLRLAAHQRASLYLFSEPRLRPEATVEWQAADLVERLVRDAARYRWLRIEFAAGRETYIGEAICSENEMDAYIDAAMRK